MALIRTKSVYEKKADGDGLRVLVMRFWPRGVKKDAADVWLKELGPSALLIKRWKTGETDWEGFRKAYVSEYQAELKKQALSQLKKLMKSNRAVTLLCGCKDEGRCHRSVLKHVLSTGGASGIHRAS